jgi:hypothetical protein
MILDLRSRDVMIIKYLMIILITYNKVIAYFIFTCHMAQCYIIIWSYSPIILLYYMNNMIKYLDCHYIIWCYVPRVCDNGIIGSIFMPHFKRIIRLGF